MSFKLSTVQSEFKKQVVEEMIDNLGKDVTIVDTVEVVRDKSYLDLDPFDPQLDGYLEQIVTDNVVFKAVVKWMDGDIRVFEHGGIRLEGDVIIMVKTEMKEKIDRSNQFIVDGKNCVKHHVVPAGSPETSRYYVALKQTS